MYLAVIIVMLTVASCHPIEDSTTENYETTIANTHIVNLQRDVNLIGFVENFKQVMAQYVNSQYKNLTIHEMEKVKLVLEEFLQNFARDLSDTIQNKNNDLLVVDEVVNEEPFAEIKRKIVLEFPEVTEEIADKIIIKLKNNLYTTRNKLDDIIKESYRAQLEHSQ